MPIAKRAADEVSAIFPKPIKLEFEKIYYPFLLMNKKRYAGLLWTSTEKYDKLDAKGLETVRRDNCLLVRTLVDTCLRKVSIICCDVIMMYVIIYTINTLSTYLQHNLSTHFPPYLVLHYLALFRSTLPYLPHLTFLASDHY